MSPDSDAESGKRALRQGSRGCLSDVWLVVVTRRIGESMMGVDNGVVPYWSRREPPHIVSEPCDRAQGPAVARIVARSDDNRRWRAVVTST